MMATLHEHDETRPSIGRGVFLAPTAALFGDVRLAPDAPASRKKDLDGAARVWNETSAAKHNIRNRYRAELQHAHSFAHDLTTHLGDSPQCHRC